MAGYGGTPLPLLTREIATPCPPAGEIKEERISKGLLQCYLYWRTCHGAFILFTLTSPSYSKQNTDYPKRLVFTPQKDNITQK